MNSSDYRETEWSVEPEIEMTDLTLLGTEVLYELALELANRENLACFETCTKVKCQHVCPPVMVPLLVYCYAAGIYSSQEIEELSFNQENLKRLFGDKWVQNYQIRCFRRENRGLLRSCLTGLIHEALVRSGTTAPCSGPAEQASKGMKPEAWTCELEAEARIQLAILFDSMELDS